MKHIWGSEVGGARMKFTADGGLAILLVNKTGAASIKGYCVTAASTGTDHVDVVPIGVPNPIGVFLDSGVPDGQNAWVVVSGRAYVYFWDSTVRGYLARTGIAADTGEVAGQALSEAIPTSPFDVDKHFCEIGHCLETRTGAGLALVDLHFN
jgi:hypothetical protein